MKKIIFILMLLFASPLWGASLQWDAPTQNTDGSALVDLAGYNAYDVTGARTKLNASIIPTSICVSGVCTWPLAVLPTEGKKYVVTAVDTGNNESGDSNIATYVTTPRNPGGLIIKVP